VEWKDGQDFSLSAPIIQVNCSDLMNDEKMKALKEVFKIWVQIDRENCDLIRYGLSRFRMPYSYRVNEAPAGGVIEIGLATPEEGLLDRGILTAAESAECIGGQLGRLGDLSGALRATLFVDHLLKTHRQLFEGIPRWRNGIPADLAKIVVRALNEAVEGQEASYVCFGLYQVQKALDNYPLVQSFLERGARTKEASPAAREPDPPTSKVIKAGKCANRKNPKRVKKRK